MLGTITNCTAILVGSAAGAIIKKGIREEYKNTMMQGLGLAAAALGINNFVGAMPKSSYPVLFICSLAFGGLLGEVIGLDKGFLWLAGKCSKGRLAEGLSTAVLLFCAGTLSILGPIESALHGENTLLFTNAVLDGVTAMVLASGFGMGIALSAVVLFFWQGSIYFSAHLIAGFITPELLNELTIVGGVLILSSALNILEIKKIKTLNLLPALAIPPLFFAVRGILGF